MDLMSIILKKTPIKSESSQDQEKPEDDPQSETEKKQEPTDEEYDALNDETFGQATFDEDWEQQHESLVSTVEEEPRPTEKVDDNLSNFVIRRPLRAEDVEAMLLSSGSPSKPIETAQDSDAKAAGSGGWSPFSMQGFISNLNPTRMLDNPSQAHNTYKNSSSNFGTPHVSDFRPLIQQNQRNERAVAAMAPQLLPFLPFPVPNASSHQRSQFQHQFPYQHRQFYHQSRGHYQHQRNYNTDRYAGLMTQSNKEWLLKILNSALNFSNPYKEDFYYVSFKTRQLTAAAKAKKGNKGSQIPALIIPERKTDESTKVEYVPVQFDGSLGKLQVANVKCPRKLLDVDFRQTTKIIDPSQDRPTTPIGRAELNAFRRLLLEIEQLYVVMLDIDEEDKKMGALPEDQRMPHVKRRCELCNQLFRGVYDEKTENINLRIAGIRKGIALIVRSLQVLSDANHKTAIVKSILDENNIHYVTNYRDRGLHQLDFKEILMEILTSLKESNLPEIDKLTLKLDNLSILSNQP